MNEAIATSVIKTCEIEADSRHKRTTKLPIP